MGQFLQGAGLLPLKVLKVSNQMALDALALLKCALHQQRYLAREDRLGACHRFRPAAQILAVQFHPLLERQFQAAQIEVGVRRCRIASPVTHVDLFVGVQHEEIQRIVPIAIEQSHVHVVHAHDPDADVLRELFAQR